MSVQGPEVAVHLVQKISSKLELHRDKSMNYFLPNKILNYKKHFFTSSTVLTNRADIYFDHLDVMPESIKKIQNWHECWFQNV